jgi:hypothetical protein
MKNLRSGVVHALFLVASLSACCANQGFTAAGLEGGKKSLEQEHPSRKTANWPTVSLALQNCGATPARLEGCQLVVEVRPGATNPTCALSFVGTLAGSGWEPKAPDPGDLGQIVLMQLTDADRRLVTEWKMGLLAISCGTPKVALAWATTLSAEEFRKIANAEIRLQPYEWRKCK